MYAEFGMKNKLIITHCSECCVGSLLQYRLPRKHPTATYPVTNVIVIMILSITQTFFFYSSESFHVGYYFPYISKWFQ